MSDDKQAAKDPFQPTQEEVDQAWEAHVTACMVDGDTHRVGRQLMTRLLRAEKVTRDFRQMQPGALHRRLLECEELMHDDDRTDERLRAAFGAIERNAHMVSNLDEYTRQRIGNLRARIERMEGWGVEVAAIEALREQVARLSAAVDVDMDERLRETFSADALPDMGPKAHVTIPLEETATFVAEQEKRRQERKLHEVLRKKPHPSLPLRDRGAANPVRLDAKDDGLWCIIPNAAFNLMHLGPQQARNAAIETWELLRGQPWNRHANEPLDVASQHGADYRVPKELREDPRTDRDQT